jgi:predicted 2-oxoglutarate/Fe(II)-dependent dioxygenase YbiX
MDYILHSDDAFTLTDFFSVDECAEQIATSEAIGYRASQINTGRGQAYDLSIRNNERVLLDDEELAHILWDRLKHYLPNSLANSASNFQPSGLNERIRYYRYKEGAYFAWHRDGPYERNPDERSKMTFMVYLNDDFVGGETDFGDFLVRPKTGDALCFEHSMMHEGRSVSSGIKYVLRADVMYTRCGT